MFAKYVFVIALPVVFLCLSTSDDTLVIRDEGKWDNFKYFNLKKQVKFQLPPINRHRFLDFNIYLISYCFSWRPLTAVSYTHLDVYKRQIWSNPINYNSFL